MCYRSLLLSQHIDIVSNGTHPMLHSIVEAAGMDGIFSHVLSADTVGKYKSAPEVYQLGPDAFCTPVGKILFVSSNCWDACGATWFGYAPYNSYQY
jgi:2-haloacid dehalogenase